MRKQPLSPTIYSKVHHFLAKFKKKTHYDIRNHHIYVCVCVKPFSFPPDSVVC